MDIAKKIRVMLAEEDKKLVDLAELLGTSQQNLGAKMKRNNFSVSEMLEIAEILGYELKIEFIKNER